MRRAGARVWQFLYAWTCAARLAPDHCFRAFPLLTSPIGFEATRRHARRRRRSGRAGSEHSAVAGGGWGETSKLL